MANIADIQNEFLRQEVEEYLERPEEIARTVGIFAKARPAMQDIAAALIEGENGTVDRLTRAALEDGVDALEIMDDGLIAGMGVVGIKFRESFIFVPEVLACARAMKAGMATHRAHPVSCGRQAPGQGHHGDGQRGSPRHRQESVHHDAPGCGICGD